MYTQYIDSEGGLILLWQYGKADVLDFGGHVL